MSAAYDLARHLETQGLGLTGGTNLFVASEPVSPVDCVILYDSGGIAPSQDYSGVLFVEHPTVQVRTRSGAYLAGDTLARQVRNVLRTIVHTTLYGHRYEGIFEYTPVTYLDRIDTNAGLAHVWTNNFNIIMEEDCTL